MSSPATVAQDEGAGRGLVRSRGFLVLLLAGAVLAVYAPTWQHDFVYDDVRFIAGNPALDTIDPVRFLIDPSTVDPTGGFEGIYRPLRTLSFATQVAVFGRDPSGFLAVNAFLHFLNALLVFAVMVRLLKDRATAVLAAFFFAIHPVMVEGVAWATSHDNGLCALFFLLAVRAYLGGGDGPWRLTAVGAAFSLALLAKETAAMLPAILAWYELTVGADGASLRRSISDALKRRWRSVVLFVVIACVYGFLRYEALGEASGQRSVWWEDSPLRTRLTAVVAIAMGLLRLAVPLLPRAFAFDYRLGIVRSIADWRFCVSAAACAGLVAVAIFGRRRHPFLSFAIVWYALLVLPTANLLVPINIFYADRFLYLAAIGPLAWLASGVVRLARSKGKVAIPGLAGFVVVCFTVAVWNVAAWRDDATLWSRVLAADAQNPRAHHAYAFALEGDSPEVVAERREHLETALAIEPDYPPARRELGALLRRIGETELAIRTFEELVARVESSPMQQGLREYAYACRELVELHAERGRFERALAYAERFVAFAPGDPALRVRMGELAERLGDVGLARAYYADALQIDPRLATARAALERLSSR